MPRRMLGGFKAFLGDADGVVNVDGGNVSDFGLGPTFARIEFRSSGQVWGETDQSGNSQLDSGTDWIIPNAKADSSYDVRCTLNSGDSPSGPTLGSWHAMSTNRGWTLTPGVPGTLSCSLNIQIRKDGGAEIDAGTYNLASASAS